MTDVTTVLHLQCPQTLLHQTGFGFSSSRKFRSLSEIYPSLPGQRISLYLQGANGHFSWCIGRKQLQCLLLFFNFDCSSFNKLATFDVHSLHSSLVLLWYFKVLSIADSNFWLPSCCLHLWQVYVLRSWGWYPFVRQLLQTSAVFRLSWSRRWSAGQELFS